VLLEVVATLDGDGAALRDFLFQDTARSLHTTSEITDKASSHSSGRPAFDCGSILGQQLRVECLSQNPNQQMMNFSPEFRISHMDSSLRMKALAPALKLFQF